MLVVLKGCSMRAMLLTEGAFGSTRPRTLKRSFFEPAAESIQLS